MTRSSTQRHQIGFTLVELLLATALAAVLFASVAGLTGRALESRAVVAERNSLQREARFAIERMSQAVSESPYLILPQPDKPDTNWRENVREETVPPSPPEGDSTNATAVLSVALGVNVDLDADGFPDADNDRDGRIDEDFPEDILYDFDPGVHLIDDGGDGSVDEGFFSDGDDDERLNSENEDPINGVDDDGDGIIDEDPGADMNGDGAPGVAGLDDDGDGQIDEGSVNDDDEDGSVDEDWLDAVVFYLQGENLVERHPVPWDETANGFVSGRDFVISTIAQNVTLLRIDRPLSSSGGAQLIDITLELTGESGESVLLQTRMRLGATR